MAKEFQIMNVQTLKNYFFLKNPFNEKSIMYYMQITVLLKSVKDDK